MSLKQEVSDRRLAAVVLVAFIAICIWAAAASGATKSDTPPMMTNGGVQCKFDDAGTNAAELLLVSPITTRNTFAIMNDSTSKIWIGTNRTLLQDSGFPVCAGCGLSIDLGYQVNTPMIADGGGFTGSPNLYCTTGRSGVNQGTGNDTRWIQVK